MDIQIDRDSYSSLRVVFTRLVNERVELLPDNGIDGFKIIGS